MNFLAAIHHGLQEIWGHKLRSLLTLMCVMLGVASLVLVNGFIDGLFSGWKISTNESGGLEKIRITPEEAPTEQRHFKMISPGLSERDGQRILALCPEVDFLAVQISNNALLRYKGKSWGATVTGATPAFFPTNRFEVAEGRPLADLDEANRAQVIVLGQEAVANLFQKNQPVLGKSVEFQGVPFVIVGVLKKYEAFTGSYNMLGAKNRTVIMPLSTMKAKVRGATRISQITLRIADSERLPQIKDTLTNIVRQLHRGVDDFEIQTNDEALASFNSVRGGFVLAGGGIAAISLLVSGIGIMNLMLASIHERVREIGLRKALGAWSRDIFVQFLVEAVTLSVLGGILGIFLGVAVIELLQGMEEFRPELSLSSVLIGFWFSVAIGIISGIYPAFQASRLDPIEALRYD